jgi:hypothetical protein
MNLSSLINKGLITVYGPLVLFVVICGFISNWIAKSVLKLEKPDFITAIIVFIAIMIGWVWWSFKIVKWKYWAFSQVQIEDGYELYEKAIEVGLIWPTGSVFNKTEIWTARDKQKWTKIEPEIKQIFELENE